MPCRVRRDDGRALHRHLRRPRKPRDLGPAPDPAQLAGVLGLEPRDIGFDRHRPSRYGAPVSFCYVPVKTREAMDRIRVDTRWFAETFAAIGDDHPAIFAYTRETVEPSAGFHARMFAPGLGIAEDPATGSAAAGFSGVLAAFEGLPDGQHGLVIEQGFAMGRPSRIHLGVTLAGARWSRSPLAAARSSSPRPSVPLSPNAKTRRRTGGSCRKAVGTPQR